MKMYPDSAYGFCEVCRKTDVPTTLDNADGTFDIICPSCAEAMHDDAECILPDGCTFRGCSRVAVTLCGKCGDAICSFHENKDGQCDLCSPFQSYSRGWSNSGHHFDH